MTAQPRRAARPSGNRRGADLRTWGEVTGETTFGTRGFLVGGRPTVPNPAPHKTRVGTSGRTSGVAQPSTDPNHGAIWQEPPLVWCGGLLACPNENQPCPTRSRYKAMFPSPTMRFFSTFNWLLPTIVGRPPIFMKRR